MNKPYPPTEPVKPLKPVRPTKPKKTFWEGDLICYINKKTKIQKVIERLQSIQAKHPDAYIENGDVYVLVEKQVSKLSYESVLYSYKDSMAYYKQAMIRYKQDMARYEVRLKEYKVALEKYNAQEKAYILWELGQQAKQLGYKITPCKK